MDPIPDLDTLRGHLDRLAAKGLVVWLSPPGRGRMLTHGLLPEEKLEKVRSQVGLATPHPPPGASEPMVPEPQRPSPPAAATAPPADRLAHLEAEVAALRARLDSLEADLGR